MSNSSHTLTFVARSEHIDVYGHVNNTVWLRWMEDLATAHWNAVARPQDRDAYAWFVTRHEIDYRGNILEGESCTGTTEIREGPSGARFDRHTTFRDANDKVLVTARTTWAMIDRATGKLMRVPPEVAAPFLPETA